jgi:signal transduction histidine kinase
MALGGTLAAVALDGAAAALLGWTTWAAFRARERPSARVFLVLIATLTAWALVALGMELAAVSPVQAVSGWLELASFGLGVVVPGIWTVYVLGYAGRGTGLTLRRVVMLSGIALPVALGAGVVGVGFLAADLPDAVVEPILASLLAMELFYLFALYVYAAYLLVRLGWTHARISKLQIAVLLLAISVPYLAGAMGSSDAVADGVTVGLLGAGGLFAVAVRRYPVLTGFPRSESVARTRVVEALREAVVVLDWEGHVLDANETTAELFDRSTDAIVGEPVESVVDGIEGHDLSAGTTGTVTLRTTKGRRQFQYSVSAVGSGGGEGGRDPVARAVVFRDVTDRQTREQRLTVLNRVLRHNVRNELDVVLAHADRVDDGTLRDGIRDSATDLVELSEKAREAEAIMQASTESPEPVDLVAVATEVAEQYRTKAPDSEIALSCPDEMPIASHRTVLRRVLAELVDNAVTHAGDSPVRVEISVRRADGGTVEVAVADDGPGIPERERAILTGGTETPLEHGRGIGLWMVNWTVTQLGGELALAENDPRGSVVTVRLHDAEYASRDREQVVDTDG